MDYWKPNTTVAAVIERDGRFLMVEEQTADGLRLNQPAGHLDEGESPAQAVVREAFEETAHRVEPVALVGIYLARSANNRAGTDVTYLRFAFACRAGEVVPGQRLDDGIVRAVWMTPDEIRASVGRHRSPAVLRVVEDHLAGRRFPLDLVHTDDSVFAPRG